MAERIEYMPELRGEPEDQIRQIWIYLRKMTEQLNRNQEMTDDRLAEIIRQATGKKN